MVQGLTVDDTLHSTMSSPLSCYFSMVLIAITSFSATSMSMNHNVRNNKPLSWYPPSKGQPEDSYFPSPRINYNEKPPSRRNSQLNSHGNLRHPSSETGQIPALNFFKKDLKYHHFADDQDHQPNVVKRDSNYKIYKNPDNTDPDLNFYKKDFELQNMEDSSEEDPGMDFLKKGSERRDILNQFERDPNEEEQLKYPVQPYPPNIEDYYDSEAAEDNKIEYQTTQAAEDDDDYIEADDEEVIAKPQKDSKVKREDLSPLAFKQLGEGVEKELEGILGPAGSNPCSNCSAIKAENDNLKSLIVNETARDLLPANSCDRWFPRNRTCWLDRNIGDTITFVLSFGEGPKNAQVQWRQEFHLLNSKKTRHFDIDSEKPMWNVVIGSRGHEFRISPITETDVDNNFFSAIILLSETKMASLHAHHRVNYRIKLIPIDQGFVYPGETIVLNMRRHTLPRQGLRFKWYMEKDGETSTLPSNMKLSPTGEVLYISELRQEQKGIVTCSVFTNLGFFATKQRYLLNVSGSIGFQDSGLLFAPSTTTTAAPKAGKRRRRSLDAEENLEKALINLDSNRKQINQQDLNPSNYPNNDRLVQSLPQSEDSIQTHQLPNNNFRTNFPNNNFDLASRRTRRQNFGRSQRVGLAQNDEIDESNRNVNKFQSIAMEVGRRQVTAEERADDNISKLIASCTSDVQCAPDATCVPGAGFCRCTTGYQGNGLFCWADAQLSIAVVEQMEGLSRNEQPDQLGQGQSPVASNY